MASGVVAPGALPTMARQPASQAATSAAARWDAVTRWLTWGAFGVLLLVAALAPIARTGDAHQYYAMATALADRRPPSLTAAEVERFKAWLFQQPVESAFAAAERAVDQPPLIVDGRQEFSHFWLYPLLAAPIIALMDALTLHPGYAFLMVNAGLLGLALWTVQRAFSPVVALLLLASPVIWFVNKAQVEVFTFSLLAIAMAQARQGRFLAAGLAAAIAATQNAPILAAVACFWAAGLLHHLVRRPRPPITRRAIALVVMTVAVGAMHPAYYLWRLGVLTPQQLNGGIGLGLPSAEAYLAVLIDPDIGLLPWMPLYGLIATIGLAMVWLNSPSSPQSWGEHAKLTSPTIGPGAGCPQGVAAAGSEGFGIGRPWRDEETLNLRLAALCGLIIGAWFLFVFAQTTNVNSGGTVHISRYALWLAPLALPLLAATTDWLRPRAPALLPLAGLIAFVGYAFYFQPARTEHYLTPSPQAVFVTTWAPELYRSVPEIFYERRHQVDGGVRGSAASSTCRVILLHAESPETPCRLSPEEATTVQSLLAADWQAAWIVRPGPLDLGESRVTGALPRP